MMRFRGPALCYVCGLDKPCVEAEPEDSAVEEFITVCESCADGMVALFIQDSHDRHAANGFGGKKKRP